MPMMKHPIPDIEQFERQVFKRKKPLALLLSYSLALMQARHVGLLYGTDWSKLTFLSPDRWDRGVIHKFNGRGISGWILKYFGTSMIRFKGLSPVRFYKESHLGVKTENDGIIPFVFRKHKDYYKKGLKILIINNLQAVMNSSNDHSYKVSIHSYDGNKFKAMPDLKVNSAIVKCFHAQNFISAYIPDYGAIVFNTILPQLLEKTNGTYVHEQSLQKRLNLLISAIEMASLANLGRARGQRAVRVIWRKEKNLRKTALELKQKQIELDAQKAYLRAVGAVNARQLNMEALNISDGVYAFIDMVGSAVIRKSFTPKDYFFILNLCLQIAADNANRFYCRVDNFIGDSVFLQNTSVFDDPSSHDLVTTEERGMLMTLALASFFQEIEKLKQGSHHLDKVQRVKQLLDKAQVPLDFRAGVEIGPAMVGPLGSEKRKIVTAIGKAVNTASRLESSGAAKTIHISENMMYLLNHAEVTRKTIKIHQALSEKEDSKNILKENPCPFFKCYQAVSHITDPVIEERNNVIYKEFSKKVTYLLHT